MTKPRAARALFATMLGLLAGTLTGAVAAAAPAAPAPAAVALAESAPLATPGPAVEATPAGAEVEFDVALRLHEPAAAVEFLQSVSDPTSPEYRHFLTPRQWEKRFSPSRADVAAVTAWLRSEGIAVESVTPDELTVHASAPAATVATAFGTSLGEYRSEGRLVRLASGPLTVPTTLAPLISAVTGVDQRVERPTALVRPGGRARPEIRASGEAQTPAAEAGLPAISGPLPPPPGERFTSPPCSGYWGELNDVAAPPWGDGYPHPLPYDVCGYKPPQLQSAYGLAGGDDGAGVTVAIVDAYAASTLLKDAQQYSARNQAGEPLKARQFKEDLPGSYDQANLCEPEEWPAEQAIDIESVHATAPGADILYVGAKNCTSGLFDSVQEVVDRHLADIVSDSWGQDGGDLLDPPDEREAFDDVLLMAGGTGVGVQFAAGDEGDEYINFGFDVIGYPESSPYQTAVGGTSLEIDAAGARALELGWSTSTSALCSDTVEEHEAEVEERSFLALRCSKRHFGDWEPSAPGAYLFGGGGFTSYSYAEPWYQEGVVPAALADRNQRSASGPKRVVPDISMDADPFTGLVIGETLSFPNGTYYEEVTYGGTSVSTPLFAGLVADADEAAGGALGFLNPLLYSLAASPKATAGAFYDVLAAKAKQDFVLENNVNGLGPEEGLFTLAGSLGDEGEERFCKSPHRCTEAPIALHAAPGYDSMTGIGSPGPDLVSDLATG